MLTFRQSETNQKTEGMSHFFDVLEMPYMPSQLIAYPMITQKKIWVPLFVIGALSTLGWISGGAHINSGLVGILLMLIIIYKLAVQNRKVFKIDEKGLSTPEFGRIPWSDIKDLSWTVERIPSGGHPMPEKWRKMLIMHIDVYNREIYWSRISWYQKRLHKADKRIKGRSDRLRKSLKHFHVDQEEIVRQACLLFYEYKQEKATICYRAQLDPAA